MAVGDVYEMIPGRGSHHATVHKAIEMADATPADMYVVVAEGLTPSKAGELVARLKKAGVQAHQRSDGEAGQRVFAAGRKDLF